MSSDERCTCPNGCDTIGYEVEPSSTSFSSSGINQFLNDDMTLVNRRWACVFRQEELCAPLPHVEIPFEFEWLSIHVYVLVSGTLGLVFGYVWVWLGQRLEARHNAFDLPNVHTNPYPNTPIPHTPTPTPTPTHPDLLSLSWCQLPKWFLIFSVNCMSTMDKVFLLICGYVLRFYQPVVMSGWRLYAPVNWAMIG